MIMLIVKKKVKLFETPAHQKKEIRCQDYKESDFAQKPARKRKTERERDRKRKQQKATVYLDKDNEEEKIKI